MKRIVAAVGLVAPGAAGLQASASGPTSESTQLPVNIEMTKRDWALLDADYNRSEVDRTAAGRYKPVQRGSMRIVRDLYRTENEQAEFVSAGLLVKLPGQRK